MQQGCGSQTFMWEERILEWSLVLSTLFWCWRSFLLVQLCKFSIKQIRELPYHKHSWGRLSGGGACFSQIMQQCLSVCCHWPGYVVSCFFSLCWGWAGGLAAFLCSYWDKCFKVGIWLWHAGNSPSSESLHSNVGWKCSLFLACTVGGVFGCWDSMKELKNYN